MESIFFLALLGLFIWFSSKLNGLQAEVTALKKQIGLSGATAKPAIQNLYAQTPGQFAPASIAQPASIIPRAETVGTPAQRPAEPNPFVHWLTEDIFMKLGALFLLMGFGWFVSYAFANNWIGPVGRVSLGLLAGMAVMGLGTWRIATYRHQGSVFLVLGSGIILLTLFAARELYDFITPGIALLLMFLSVSYVALMSVVYQSEKLALAGLIMAAVAPLLTNTPEPSVVGLMSYLLVVVLGTLWLVRLTGSHMLSLAAVIMMILYSLPFMDGGAGAEEQMALLFAFIFAGIFFVTNTISIVLVQTDVARKAQIYTAAFTGLFTAMWIALVVPETLQSLTYVFWMVIFSVGTFFVFMHTTNRVPFYIYGAVTIGFLFAATAAELSGTGLTLAYTAQVAAILVAARLVLSPTVSDKLVWLFGLPIILSLPSFIASSWRDGFAHLDFMTLLLVGGALGIVGLVYLQTKQAQQSLEPVGEVLLVGALAYGLSLVWLVLHAVMLGDSATTMSLIVYTLLGIWLLLVGRTGNNQWFQIIGGALLGGVVVRLLLVDVWQMDLIGRIITFLAIGGLLIMTAFIKKTQPTEQIN